MMRETVGLYLKKLNKSINYKMRFFCMDAHVSVIHDLKTMNLDIDITDWTLSNHAWVVNRQKDNPVHINSDTVMKLNSAMIKNFQDEYDQFLSQFDGFIVCHIPAFAMIYEKYRKPVIWINSCRFDLPFSSNVNGDKVTRDEFITCIKRINNNRLLYPVSNNKGDQLCTENGTGIKTQHIPSLCDYTGISYKPTRSTFLLYTGNIPPHPLITSKDNIGNKYNWKTIGEFKGVIHMPYEISTMSMFEQFTAGIPLFFPSREYLKQNKHQLHTMREYEKFATSYKLQLDEWIDLSDMYTTFNSKNTYYFDSLPHLYSLLEKFEYVDDKLDRIKHKEEIIDKWRSIILDIKTYRIRNQSPVQLSYNRLPLLANSIYDINYAGSGVVEQHNNIRKKDIRHGDIIFVKTNLLESFLSDVNITSKITLVTGVSDITPSAESIAKIISNDNIVKWIGCNIPIQHPKIEKIPIGVGEPQRINGNHSELVKLHNSRIPWNNKPHDVCVPFHSKTHVDRLLKNSLSQLSFYDYMSEINKYKFVVCQAGNGLDTHRFCETLLMGSVPIIKHSELDDMYAKFPCLIVDKFESFDTINDFKWDDEKYNYFLDVFWLRNANIFRQSLFLN